MNRIDQEAWATHFKIVYEEQLAEDQADNQEDEVNSPIVSNKDNNIIFEDIGTYTWLVFENSA